MPLSKLWNSLRGRTTQSKSVAQPAESDPRLAGSASESPAKSRKSGAAGFGLFGGGPHARLCKMVRTAAKSTPLTSIVEIGVEDGTRAVALLETLEKTGNRVRYVAIDEFDLGGQVTLKQFHQSLRAKLPDSKPQLFPGPLAQGLMRIAHTLGTVDLVVISEPPESWRTPAMLAVLARICSENTIVFYRESDDASWGRVDDLAPAAPRRAA